MSSHWIQKGLEIFSVYLKRKIARFFTITFQSWLCDLLLNLKCFVLLNSCRSRNSSGSLDSGLAVTSNGGGRHHGGVTHPHERGYLEVRSMGTAATTADTRSTAAGSTVHDLSTSAGLSMPGKVKFSLLCFSKFSFLNEII